MTVDCGTDPRDAGSVPGVPAGIAENPFRYAKRKKHPVWKKAFQIAACLLLVCAVGFGAAMVLSPSARAGFMRWIRTVGVTGVTYDFYAEPMEQVPPRYEIGALPAGYVETELLFSIDMWAEKDEILRLAGSVYLVE